MQTTKDKDQLKTICYSSTLPQYIFFLLAPSYYANASLVIFQAPLYSAMQAIFKGERRIIYFAGVGARVGSKRTKEKPPLPLPPTSFVSGSSPPLRSFSACSIYRPSERFLIQDGDRKQRRFSRIFIF